MGGMSEQDILHVTFEPPINPFTPDIGCKSWIPISPAARKCGVLLHPSNGLNDRGRKDMRKIQVLLPEEMISYLQSIVESGETESMSQTIRKIIMKEMKANETQ